MLFLKIKILIDMISVYLNGRLGNQIFQYVMTRILSEKLHLNFWIPKNKEESIEFYSNISKKFNRYLELPVETNPHYWIGNDLFDINFGNNDGNIDLILDEDQYDNFISYNNRSNILLLGFFQNNDYFKNKRYEIVKWLSFTDKVKSESKNILEKYPVDKYCYIHFRGGDYKNIIQYYLPKEYYLKSINKIKEINVNLKFLIITDDLEEAKKMFPDYEIISNSMHVDFYLLNNSKYTIIPNSSFSWWSSWLNLNNIITIAPNRWFNYNKGGDFSPKNIKTEIFTYVD